MCDKWKLDFIIANTENQVQLVELSNEAATIGLRGIKEPHTEKYCMSSSQGKWISVGHWNSPFTWYYLKELPEIDLYDNIIHSSLSGDIFRANAPERKQDLEDNLNQSRRICDTLPQKSPIASSIASLYVNQLKPRKVSQIEDRVASRHNVFDVKDMKTWIEFVEGNQGSSVLDAKNNASYADIVFLRGNQLLLQEFLFNWYYAMTVEYL